MKTPRGRIRNTLRMLWLRSKERAFALKRDGYTCQMCMKKQSKKTGVKVEVHHRNGITNWQAVEDAIYEHILCAPEGLVTLCTDCHDKLHRGEK